MPLFAYMGDGTLPRCCGHCELRKPAGRAMRCAVTGTRIPQCGVHDDRRNDDCPLVEMWPVGDDTWSEVAAP